MVFPCFHAVFTRTRMQRDRSHNGSFRCRPRERERKREMVVLIEYKVEEAACFIGVFYRERGGNTISFRRGFWPFLSCTNALGFALGHYLLPRARMTCPDCVIASHTGDFLLSPRLLPTSLFSMSLPLFQPFSPSLSLSLCATALFSPLGSGVGVVDGCPPWMRRSFKTPRWNDAGTERRDRVLRSPRWSQVFAHDCFRQVS